MSLAGKAVEAVARAPRLVHQKSLVKTSLYGLTVDRKGIQGAPDSLELLLAAGAVSFSLLEVRSGIELAGVVAWALSRCSLGVTAMSRQQP